MAEKSREDMMAESQEEKLRIILGFRMETIGGGVYSQQVYQYMNKTVCRKDELKIYLQSGNGQARIRQRVRELLDELKLIRFCHRLPSFFVGKSGLKVEEHNSILIKYATTSPQSKPLWSSGWFLDTDLAQKEQDLLFWLAEKGKKIPHIDICENCMRSIYDCEREPTEKGRGRDEG